MAVDHVDDLELVAMEILGRGGAAVLGHDHDKLSSARLRTVEDTHWSVKMPATATLLMPSGDAHS